MFTKRTLELLKEKVEQLYVKMLKKNKLMLFNY